VVRIRGWNSFQKQIHAIEIDDGMANVQHVRAEDSGDFRVALLQRELRQLSDIKFFRRHFERADGEVVEFCCADLYRLLGGWGRGAPGGGGRDVRWRKFVRSILLWKVFRQKG
jgi:hypothetical protein